MMKEKAHIFLYAVLAGCCIGLGGIVYLRIKDAFDGANIIGAMLFTVGLFTICARGYNLFTGKACYIFDNPPSYALTLAIIWLGNLMGCILFSSVLHLTSLCGENGIDAAAAVLVEAKMNCGLLDLFVLAVICNMCIFLATNGYVSIPHEVGKYLALFFGVMVFILAGTEHSVADMFFWSLSGVLYEKPVDSFGRILVVTLGNVVGGAFLPVCEKLGKRLE